MFLWKNSLYKHILFNIIFLLSNCQVKIPLTFFPIYNINLTSPSNIFEYYIEQRIYANLEIGEPKQIIQIPLNFDSNDFYIVDDDVFSNDSQKFSNFKFYDSDSSKDHNIIDEDYKNGDYFDLATYDNDTFYFNNKKNVLEFYSPIVYDYCDSGGIGMQLLPQSDINDATIDEKRTFFGKLKQIGVANDYYWSIFYNSKEYKKQDEGFLLLGCLPHEIKDTDLGYYKKGSFKEKNKGTFYMPFSNPPIKNILEIDSIYSYEGNNINKNIEDFPSGNTDYKKYLLDYSLGGIKIPKNLQIFYHRVFEEYIIKGECFNDTFKKKSYIFYYCKNNKTIINKIKNVFPGLNLRSQDLRYNFTLEAKDLFIEEKNLIFCLIYFSTSSYDKQFIMGKPFLKKYQFALNYKMQNIIFYRDDERGGGDLGNKISIQVFVVVLIGTIVLVLLISYIIFKFYLYERFFRKKRANELDDGDYYYPQKEENENEKASLTVN